MPKVYFEWDREPMAIVREFIGKRKPAHLELYEIDEETLNRWKIDDNEYQRLQDEMEQFIRTKWRDHKKSQ